MRLRIRLPWGTLKFKHESYLRRPEREREVPVWRIGERHYLIWWPSDFKRPTEGQS